MIPLEVELVELGLAIEVTQGIEATVLMDGGHSLEFQSLLSGASMQPFYGGMWSESFAMKAMASCQRSSGPAA